MTSLILGLSTRAIAESAVCSGHRVITLDYFGDFDQKAQVENYSLARDYRLAYNVENLLKASRRLQFDTVIYTSNLENHPNVVEKLARRAEVLGNGPDILRQVRNWAVLREFCRQRSIPHPQTLLPGEEKQATLHQNWLCKPICSGGGSGIRPWDGKPIKQDQILQARVEGLPASAAFVANGKEAVVFGMTRQLIGQRELGGKGYCWCGNILPLPLDPGQERSILEAVEHIVTQLTRHFGLKGVGGIDFVVSGKSNEGLQPYLVEINPRYTASMELMEWAYGINVFTLHVEGTCGHLPQFSLGEHLKGAWFGKGIVFAHQAVTIQNMEPWWESGWRDIPFPGDTFKPGQPVCTVLVRGDTYDACLENLLKSAASVRHEIRDVKDLLWKTY